MPKSKKKKNRDFQKVKLKVGKEKRSGNETDLSFKTRTIKVTQTLKDSSTRTQEAHTKKNLTFEDLMKRCNANKPRTQRLSAVEGLRELALATEGTTSQASFWRPKFCEVMRGVATLFSDPEPVVRQGVIQLCRTLFSVVGECAINLDAFCAHLCCAMGHISDDTRQDALVIFDMLLEMCPQSLVDSHCPMVPAFIKQISSFMVKKSAYSTMAMNPRSKVSSQKYRAGILLRLNKIVQIYMRIRRKEMEPPPEEVYHFSEYPEIRGPCMPSSWKTLWTVWPAYRRGEPQEFSEIAHYPHQLQKFICSVLPVIKDCWHEELMAEDSSGPSYGTAGASLGGPLTQDSLPAIQTVIDLLYTFVDCWRLTYLSQPNPSNRFHSSQWFLTEFVRELRELLLPQFPVVVMERAGKGGRRQQPQGKKGHSPADSDPAAEMTSLQVSVLTLNLKVCDMLASFPPKEEDWPQIWTDPEDWQDDVVSFLLKNLKRCIKAGLTTSVIRVLREVFFHFPYTEKVGRLLERAQHRFIKAHPLSVEKRELCKVLDQLAFDLEEFSPYHAGTAQVYGSHIRHELMAPYLQALPKMVLELCEVGSGEEIAGLMTKAMCYKSSSILTDAVQCHMLQLLDNNTGPFARLPQSCHWNLYMATYLAFSDVPAPEPVLEQMESIISHPNVDNKICQKFASNFSDLYKRLQTKVRRDSSLTELRQLVEDSEKSYRRFMFSVAVGHKTAELESMDRGSSPPAQGLTQVLWSCSPERFEKHVCVVDSVFQNFKFFFKRPEGRFLTNSAHITEIMAKVWNMQIMKKYGSLSVLTVWSALTHWRSMMLELGDGDTLHTDGAPCPPNVKGGGVWEDTVKDLLPVVNANMRSFTHLAFSLLHSMVAMETGEEAVEMPPGRMVEEMWRVVVSLMELSFRMFLDLLQVGTDFVQDQRSELESRRVTLVVMKLLAAEEMQHHKITYCHLLKPKLDGFVDAVKSVTSDIESRQWWLNFVSTMGHPMISAGTEGTS